MRLRDRKKKYIISIHIHILLKIDIAHDEYVIFTRNVNYIEVHILYINILKCAQEYFL